MCEYAALNAALHNIEKKKKKKNNKKKILACPLFWAANGRQQPIIIKATFTALWFVNNMANGGMSVFEIIFSALNVISDPFYSHTVESVLTSL